MPTFKKEFALLKKPWAPLGKRLCGPIKTTRPTRGTLAEKVARMTGVLLAVAIFAAYFYASALLF
ncbi:MAG: hypothetical protein ACKOAS_02890 [Verrucomicrobiota bacterium]